MLSIHCWKIFFSSVPEFLQFLLSTTFYWLYPLMARHRMVHSPHFYEDKSTIKLKQSISERYFWVLWVNFFFITNQLHFIGCIYWWHNLEWVILHTFTRIKICWDWHCVYFLSNRCCKICFSFVSEFLQFCYRFILLVISTDDTISDGSLSTILRR